MASPPVELAMKINSQFLRSHPLLSLLPFFASRKLLSESAFSEYPKGTVIFTQGGPCEAIYLIISGLLGLFGTGALRL